MHYARMQSGKAGKKITFAITTNGTLLTDEMLDVFAENDIHPIISLDGPREIHDRHRKLAGAGGPTFDIIMGKLRKILDYNEAHRFQVSAGFNTVASAPFDFMELFLCHFSGDCVSRSTSWSTRLRSSRLKGLAMTLAKP